MDDRQKPDPIASECDKAGTAMLRDLPSSSSSPDPTLGESFHTNDYVDHRVSNLDTLAGVAIKYGVEVADIKRANGLASDLHMFGHQTLKIPLLGRHVKHVPSSISQLQERSRSQKCNPKFLTGRLELSEQSETEKRPLSSAMKLLRGYYGLSSPAQHSPCNVEGMELTSYHAEREDCSEDEPLSPLTPPSTSKRDKSFLENWKGPATINTERPMSRLSHEFTPETTVVPSFVGRGAVDTGSEPSVRRRAKVEGNSPLSGASEIDSGPDSLDQIQSIYGLPNGSDSLVGRDTGHLKGSDGSVVTGKSKGESISRVIKSMSTSNLQDQAGMQTSLSSMKYGSKADTKSGNHIQALSRSLFEGIPKPALPRYKEALD